MRIRCLVLAFVALAAAAERTAALPVTLQNATATFSQDEFSVVSAIVGSSVTTGWAIHPNIVAQTAVFETATDLFMAGGSLTGPGRQPTNGISFSLTSPWTRSRRRFPSPAAMRS
jgi:hypothetical protein